MMTVIHEWPAYLTEIFRVTAPGGRIQLTEMSMNFESASGTLRKDSGLKVMERALQKYATFNRYDLQIGSNLATLAEGAGFHSVEETVFEVPVGAWMLGLDP